MRNQLREMVWAQPQEQIVWESAFKLWEISYVRWSELNFDADFTSNHSTTDISIYGETGKDNIL